MITTCDIIALKVFHVNHSSLLIENDSGNFLLTDPWFLTPAFSTWTPDPSPPLAIVRFILSIEPSKLTILISHGHDDHLDRLLSMPPFATSKFLIPSLTSPGLRNRLNRLCPSSNGIIEISNESLIYNGFTISAHVNQSFTGDDSIFVISADSIAIIHANDNWHEINKQLYMSISSHPDFFSLSVLYFVQLGIADSYPFAYPQLTESEITNTINKRLTRVIHSIELNSQLLNAQYSYLYANQAHYNLPLDQHSIYLSYVSNLKFLLNDNKHIAVQASPGLLWPSTCTVSFPATPTLFQWCFDFLYQDAYSYISQKPVDPLQLDFRFHIFDSSLPSEASIIFSSSLLLWHRILSGELTIESLLVGSNGIIYKPDNLNISPLFHLLSKWGYKAQAKINASFFSYFQLFR